MSNKTEKKPIKKAGKYTKQIMQVYSGYDKKNFLPNFPFRSYRIKIRVKQLAKM